MKFGETEYSLREFGDAMLLKKEAESVVGGYIEALGVHHVTGTMATTVAKLREHVGPQIPFYTWVIEECDREINAHIRRLKEIYADTITTNTETCQDNDCRETGRRA